jgi:hypothetical protein
LLHRLLPQFSMVTYSTLTNGLCFFGHVCHESALTNEKAAD